MVWRGEFGAFTTTGNSSNTGIIAGLTFDQQGIAWRHRLTARVDYRRANGTTTREQLLTRYEPNYQVSDNFYFYASRRLSATGSKGFQAAAVSDGLGCKVLTQDDIQLSVKAEPAYPVTEFTDGRMKVGLQGW